MDLHRKSITYNCIYIIAPIAIWFLFKISLHPLVSWLGTFVSLLGILFAFYQLAYINRKMNQLSDITKREQPAVSFKIPLILSLSILCCNLWSGNYFIQYNYFPRAQTNSVTIVITNQAEESVENIQLTYGETTRTIASIAPNEKYEEIFPRQQHNTSVQVKTDSDGIERHAVFHLDTEQTYSTIRIDPLKNILPNF